MVVRLHLQSEKLGRACRMRKIGPILSLDRHRRHAEPCPAVPSYSTMSMASTLSSNSKEISIKPGDW